VIFFPYTKHSKGYLFLVGQDRHSIVRILTPYAHQIDFKPRTPILDTLLVGAKDIAPYLKPNDILWEPSLDIEPIYFLRVLPVTQSDGSVTFPQMIHQWKKKKDPPITSAQLVKLWQFVMGSHKEELKAFIQED
jgi:hypothetical protein